MQGGNCQYVNVCAEIEKEFRETLFRDFTGLYSVQFPVSRFHLREVLFLVLESRGIVCVVIIHLNNGEAAADRFRLLRAASTTLTPVRRCERAAMRDALGGLAVGRVLVAWRGR